MPHAYLKTLNPEYEVDQIQGAKYEDVFSVADDKLKEYNIAILSREINAQGSGVEIIKRLQSLGINVVLDIDDYWQLPSSHKLKKAYELLQIPDMVMQNIRWADAVTTTNEVLAKHIKMYNDNVVVLPNCIDKNQPQFKAEHIPSNITRIGWVGGVYHRQDIEPMERSFKKLWKSKLSFQLCVGGFNPNNEYKAIESIFTSDYKYMDYDYRTYLKEFSPLLSHLSNNKPYKRLWAKSAFEYVSMYNELDVVLIPLKDNGFNNCKSELKVLEAAAMGKAVIVSDVYPYNQICNKYNSILIKGDNPHKEWFEAMKYLIENPNKAHQLSAQLTHDCNERFNIDTITNKRKELYLSL